jgi:prolipoprotein diacylglyceryltransferase
LFHLIAAAILLQLERWNSFPTQRFKLCLLAYCAYRILSEFVRPEVALALGLTGYQWTAIVLIPVILWLWHRDRRLQETANQSVT